MTDRTAVAPARRRGGRTARKHQAILDAAEQVFLRDGFAAAGMDEVAALSAVSKQTIYAHFGSKEALFVALVSSMTGAAGDGLHDEPADPDDPGALAPFLEAYALAQLRNVLPPRILRLRRLVIGEVIRFPDLARVLWERGPQRAMSSMAVRFGRLEKAGLLDVPDPQAAAAAFNWLVMGDPINRAMLLGDESVPDDAGLRRHAAEAVRVFLAAYGAKG